MKRQPGWVRVFIGGDSAGTVLINLAHVVRITEESDGEDTVSVIVRYRDGSDERFLNAEPFNNANKILNAAEFLAGFGDD